VASQPNVGGWRRGGGSGLRKLYLGNGDGAFACELLLCFFARVRIAQVGVEVFVEDLGGLLAEVTPLPPGLDEQQSVLIESSCRIRQNH